MNPLCYIYSLSMAWYNIILCVNKKKGHFYSVNFTHWSIFFFSQLNLYSVTNLLKINTYWLHKLFTWVHLTIQSKSRQGGLLCSTDLCERHPTIFAVFFCFFQAPETRWHSSINVWWFMKLFTLLAAVIIINTMLNTTRIYWYTRIRFYHKHITACFSNGDIHKPKLNRYSQNFLSKFWFFFFFCDFYDHKYSKNMNHMKKTTLYGIFILQPWNKKNG